MRHRAFVLIAALLALYGTRADAHFFPKKATSLKSFLVQNYPPCTAPEATSTTGEPACEGVAEVDPSCVFSSKGVGTFSAVVKSRTKVAIGVRMSGLDMCDGKTLTAALGVRTTSDTCPNDHCTAVDKEIVAGTCVVSHGRCVINSTIDSGFPAGAGSEMTVLSCGVKNGSLQTFSCGIMIK